MFPVDAFSSRARRQLYEQCERGTPGPLLIYSCDGDVKNESDIGDLAHELDFVSSTLEPPCRHSSDCDDNQDDEHYRKNDGGDDDNFIEIIRNPILPEKVEKYIYILMLSNY